MLVKTIRTPGERLVAGPLSSSARSLRLFSAFTHFTSRAPPPPHPLLCTLVPSFIRNVIPLSNVRVGRYNPWPKSGKTLLKGPHATRLQSNFHFMAFNLNDKKSLETTLKIYITTPIQGHLFQMAG